MLAGMGAAGACPPLQAYGRRPILQNSFAFWRRFPWRRHGSPGPSGRTKPQRAIGAIGRHRQQTGRQLRGRVTSPRKGQAIWRYFAGDGVDDWAISFTDDTSGGFGADPAHATRDQNSHACLPAEIFLIPYSKLVTLARFVVTAPNPAITSVAASFCKQRL